MFQLDGDVALPEFVQLVVVKRWADDHGRKIMLCAEPERFMHAGCLNHIVAAITQVAANRIRCTMRIGQINKRKQCQSPKFYWSGAGT